MPSYRLLYSDGRRSLRHVEVESNDMASAIQAFSPPEGWSLESAHRKWRLAAAEPQIPSWINLLMMGGPFLVAVFADAVLPSAAKPSPLYLALFYAIPVILGIMLLPHFIRFARMSRQSQLQPPADAAPREWPASRQLNRAAFAPIAMEIGLVAWAVVIVLGQFGVASAIFVGVLLGWGASDALTRLLAGEPTAAPGC